MAVKTATQRPLATAENNAIKMITIGMPFLLFVDSAKSITWDDLLRILRRRLRRSFSLSMRCRLFEADVSVEQDGDLSQFEQKYNMSKRWFHYPI